MFTFAKCKISKFFWGLACKQLVSDAFSSEDCTRSTQKVLGNWGTGELGKWETGPHPGVRLKAEETKRTSVEVASNTTPPRYTDVGDMPTVCLLVRGSEGEEP
jgi:hypothetical protein